LAQHPAAYVLDRARPEGLRDASAEKAAIVVVRDEADLLALRLVRGDQSQRARTIAHLGLREPAHGKARGGELGL
jgi:hypothetical protein